MCENGHTICDSCGSQVSKCQSCGGTLTKARNFTLERIAATVIYPCKNKESGCKETFTVNHKNSHQSECFFRAKHALLENFLKSNVITVIVL